MIDRFLSLRRYHSDRCELGPNGPWFLSHLVEFEKDFSEDDQLRRAAERFAQSSTMFSFVVHKRVAPWSQELKFLMTVFAYRMGNDLVRQVLEEEIGVAERGERPISWERFLDCYGKEYGRIRGTTRPSWRHAAKEAETLWLDYAAHILTEREPK